MDLQICINAEIREEVLFFLGLPLLVLQVVFKPLGI